MNLIDYIAIVWGLIALWGLWTAYPNWRKAVAKQAQLKARKINGFNERLAHKERRLQRNLALILLWIVVQGALIALPTIHIGPITLSGLVLSVTLLLASPYVAFWSRAERDDGEWALRELARLVEESKREMGRTMEGDGGN